MFPPTFHFFFFLTHWKKLSINWEVPENIGQKQHLKHKEWVWETFTKRGSPHDTSALKIRTGLADNVWCCTFIKQCICVWKRKTKNSSVKQTPNYTTFYLQAKKKKKERKKMKIQQHNKQTKSNRQNTPQKENQQDKTQKREGERMQLSDLRSMMHCLTKRQITTLPKLSATDREHTRKQSEEPLLVSACLCFCWT